MEYTNSDLESFNREVANWPDITQGLGPHWTYKVRIDMHKWRDDLAANGLEVMSEDELTNTIGDL